MEQEEEETGSPPDLCVDDHPDLSGAEQKQVGGLAWRVYQTYWVAVGGVLATSILMALLLMQGVDRLYSSVTIIAAVGALGFYHTFIHCISPEKKNAFPVLNPHCASTTNCCHVIFLIQSRRMFLTGGSRTGSQS